MHPLYFGTRFTIAAPRSLPQRIKSVGNVTQRTAARADYLANGISNLTQHSEVCIIDSEDLIGHRSVTRSSTYQIGDLARHDSIRAL